MRPLITKWETQSVALTVPEQLGIIYKLFGSITVDSTNWIEVTNFVREVKTNAPEVRLSRPSPAGSAGFYRVGATGR